MVAVAEHHRREIALPVVPEELCVVVHVLGQLPHIGEFVHHQQAQLVAGVQEMAGRRIVGAAHGVEAGVLELAHAAVFRRAVGLGAEQAVVMVHAASLEEQRFTVELKPFRGVDFNRTDAEAGLVAVEFHVIFRKQADFCGVKRRTVRRPEDRIRHGQVQGRSGGSRCRDTRSDAL